MPNESTLILDPIATSGIRQQQSRVVLAELEGKVIGFIDNGKPNFHYLVDDLARLLADRYGVNSVVRHRKRGSVPVPAAAMTELAEQCDAVITGSGD